MVSFSGIFVCFVECNFVRMVCVCVCVCAGHRLRVLWGKSQGGAQGKGGERGLPPVPGLPTGEWVGVVVGT